MARRSTRGTSPGSRPAPALGLERRLHPHRAAGEDAPVPRVPGGSESEEARWQLTSGACSAEHRVDFVLIGGVALVLHGSSRVTQDLDICYARDDANLERLSAALALFHPTLRGAPPGLPFVLDARSLRSGLNFTLTAEPGDVDLLGEVPGVGGYGRLKDLADLAEIEALRRRVQPRFSD